MTMLGEFSRAYKRTTKVTLPSLIMKLLSKQESIQTALGSGASGRIVLLLIALLQITTRDLASRGCW